MAFELRVCVISDAEPWFYDMQGIQCRGILCNLVAYLSKSMNFSYSFTDSPDSLGVEGTGQQWNGIIGYFQRNVINFILFNLKNCDSLSGMRKRDFSSLRFGENCPWVLKIFLRQKR